MEPLLNDCTVPCIFSPVFKVMVCCAFKEMLRVLNATDAINFTKEVFEINMVVLIFLLIATKVVATIDDKIRSA